MNDSVQKKRVYFISGLGADKRIFQFLDLDFCEPIFLEWLTPNKNESLSSYAERLAGGIEDDPATVVGISFGGMLATEIAKLHPGWKIIIISGAKTKHEIPWYWRISRHFPAYKWIPGKLMKKFGTSSNYFFGAYEKHHRKLLMRIISETNTNFTKWAIHSILTWKNDVVPPNVVHLHGMSDNLLPHKYLKADHLINGGTHLMTMDKSTEVSQLLRKIIES